MEIKSVAKETNYEYPKLNQIDKKYIQSNIPNKWIKIGLSSLVISSLMNNKVLAANFDVITPMDLGGLVYTDPTPVESISGITISISSIITLLSIVTFIITGFSILINKIKAKKQPEPKKVPKWINVLFIISIIVFILSILIRFIIDNEFY